MASTGAYRLWTQNGNSNADCVAQPTTQGFGDAKGLDLWAYVPTITIPDTVEIFDSAAELAIIKSNSINGVISGDNTTYTLTVTNNGPSNADGAVLTDTPSAGLLLLSITCTGVSGGAVCPIPPSLSVANLLGGGIALPTLPAGSTVTFQVVANVTATGLP